MQIIIIIIIIIILLVGADGSIVNSNGDTAMNIAYSFTLQIMKTCESKVMCCIYDKEDFS